MPWHPWLWPRSFAAAVGAAVLRVVLASVEVDEDGLDVEEEELELDKLLELVLDSVVSSVAF